MLDSAGGVLLALVTVRVKVLLAVRPAASVTVNVMVAVPSCAAMGARLIVRFAPDPPNEMPDAGSRAVFDEVADTVRALAAVSRSDTVNASGPAVVPS